MDNIFHPENKYIQIANRVVDMCAIGIFWIILSLTIIMIGPATTAAYHTVTKVVRRERGTLVKEFWRAFKRDFWKSLVIGLLLTFLMFATYLTDFVYNAPFIVSGENLDIVSMLLMIIKVFLLIGIGLYYFPILSRFNMSIVRMVWASALLMFRHFFSTCLIIATVLAAITIVAIFPFLLVVVPGLCFWIISFPMERILQKHMQAEDKVVDESKDQWYLS